MDQREIVRRLCNGALAQILHENNDSILNTLLINTIGNLILKRRTNKSTQTDFNVQRIGQNLDKKHLVPLYKLQPESRKNCIR